ncbi:hypothetical protein, partial [Mesorhizobium sp.]|uniref:hypothetical protein n=1 Tax=Mesorhizobium sp. TaxID=1871066 RepID=UPI0025D7D6F4
VIALAGLKKFGYGQLPALRSCPVGRRRGVGRIGQPDTLATALCALELGNQIIRHCWRLRAELSLQLSEIERLIVVALWIVAIRMDLHALVYSP